MQKLVFIQQIRSFKTCCSHAMGNDDVCASDHLQTSKIKAWGMKATQEQLLPHALQRGWTGSQQEARLDCRWQGERLVKWTSDLWLIKDKPWWWFHSTSFADKSREVSRCTLENPQLKSHICTPLRCFCQQPSPPDWCQKKLSYCCTNGRLPVAVHSQLPDIATEKKYGWIRSSCSDFYETWRPFNSLCFVHGAENGCNMKRKPHTLSPASAWACWDHGYWLIYTPALTHPETRSSLWGVGRLKLMLKHSVCRFMHWGSWAGGRAVDRPAANKDMFLLSSWWCPSVTLWKIQERTSTFNYYIIILWCEVDPHPTEGIFFFT